MFALIILGLAISRVYLFTHRKQINEQNFCLTLVMLPVLIAIIILLIGNNVARAVGLACGMGYITYAILFTIILCLLMMVLSVINLVKRKNVQCNLK